MADTSFSSDLKVTFSDQTYYYGQRSTASMIIRNPHSVPARVFSITAVAPNVDHFPTQKESGEGNEDEVGKAKSLLKDDLLLNTSVSVFGMSVAASSPKKVLNIKAESGSRIKIPYATGRYHEVNLDAQQDSIVEFVEPPEPEPDPSQAPELLAVIPAGSEKIVPIDFQQRNWLLSQPKRQQLSVEVSFEIDGKKKSQVEVLNYELVPPLKSLLIGGVLGAGLGSIARDLTSGVFDIKSIALRVVTALILSILATMILRRKESGQAFITVEDFSGAFLIGALVGYQGPEYFSTILDQVDPSQGAADQG